MNARLMVVSSCVVFSALIVGPARADLPDLPDSALDAPCAAARALDGCPECKCEALTSTSPTADAESSDIRFAILFKVAGKDALDKEIVNAHVALGTAAGLVHGGAVAALTEDYSNGITADFVGAGAGQRHDFCAGACEHDAVGLVHFFTVSTMWRNQDIGADRDTHHETERVVACFAPDGAAKAACFAVPVGWSERVTTVPGGPYQGPRPISKRGWKRTWKIADKGGVHLVLGKVTGKGEELPPNPKATKLWMTQLATAPGVVRAER